MSKNSITEKTLLETVFELKGVEKVLVKHSFPCVHCPMARLEMDRLRIGQVCKMYNIDQEALLKDLKLLEALS